MVQPHNDPGALTVADTEPEVAYLEEPNMLLIGFGIGITVGLIFLVYIVLAAAHWL